jgi:hypothetical protein
VSTPITNSRRYLSKLTFSPLRVYPNGATLGTHVMARVAMVTGVASGWRDDDLQKGIETATDSAVKTLLEQYRGIATGSAGSAERMRALRDLITPLSNASLAATFSFMTTVQQQRLAAHKESLASLEARLAEMLATPTSQERIGFQRYMIQRMRENIEKVTASLTRTGQALRQLADDTPIEPLGLLFLERLTLTPVELERGELVYSLPLAPKEKVTLSHKEWRIREEEFSQSIQDSLERYSERGVTSATELSISTNDVAARSDAVRASTTRRTSNTSRDGAANITTTERINAQDVENVTQHESSRTASVTESKNATELASSRSIQDHRVSFTVTTVVGTEDFTSRVLENASPDHVLRIDYWRRMLRWKILSERVGVRLTYSIVIPDPGYDLRQPHLELQKLEASLSQGFAFDLATAAITDATATALATQYGVALPPYNAGAVAQWQTQVWNLCRSAAWVRFSAVQEATRARRDELLKGVGNTDTYRLRRLEQEQLTFSVMRWLFPNLMSRPYQHSASETHSMEWTDMLEAGDYISFVHDAVDWDNMLVSLYPYFWDADATAQAKPLFDHADPVHREFLRAGAARVVLSIKPGFEDKVLTLVENGEIGTLDTRHPFRKVVNQVHEEHKKRLEGPDRIGEWEEYTPTGALDIDAVLRKVIEEG